jgi:hypothetical protein
MTRSPRDAAIRGARSMAWPHPREGRAAEIRRREDAVAKDDALAPRKLARSSLQSSSTTSSSAGGAKLTGSDPRVDDAAGPRLTLGPEALDLGVFDREPGTHEHLGVRLEVLRRQIRRCGGDVRRQLHRADAIDRGRRRRVVSRARR